MIESCAAHSFPGWFLFQPRGKPHSAKIGTARVCGARNATRLFSLAVTLNTAANPIAITRVIRLCMDRVVLDAVALRATSTRSEFSFNSLFNFNHFLFFLYLNIWMRYAIKIWISNLEPFSVKSCLDYFFTPVYVDELNFFFNECGPEKLDAITGVSQIKRGNQWSFKNVYINEKPESLNFQLGKFCFTN